MKFPRYLCLDCGLGCDTPCPEAIRSMAVIDRWESRLKRRISRRIKDLPMGMAAKISLQVRLFLQE